MVSAALGGDSELVTGVNAGDKRDAAVTLTGVAPEVAGVNAFIEPLSFPTSRTLSVAGAASLSDTVRVSPLRRRGIELPIAGGDKSKLLVSTILESMFSDGVMPRFCVPVEPILPTKSTYATSSSPPVEDTVVTAPVLVPALI